MKRRSFIAGAPALGAVSLVRPETLLVRKARFEEIGNAVVMTVSAADLLKKRDREATASIDSGFTTTLVYDIVVYRHGTNAPISKLRRIVDIRYHLYLRKYEVTVRGARKSGPRRYFERRDQAIDFAVHLHRIRIVKSSALERTENAYYYVVVAGQRNPLDSVDEPVSLDPGAGRAQGRDVRWFSRFLDFLAGDGPLAEEVVQFRTQPFYLVRR